MFSFSRGVGLKAEVAFLAKEDPGKLRTHMPLNNWLNITEADRRRIKATNERYATLLELSRAARERPPHPDGDALRAFMKSNIMPSEAYKSLLQEFLESVKATDAIQPRRWPAGMDHEKDK